MLRGNLLSQAAMTPLAELIHYPSTTQMTGLSAQTDRILSLCCFITDAHLNLLDTGGHESIISTPSQILESMSEWCRTTHGASGLSAACLNSTTTAEAAADSLLSYVQRYVPEPGRALLAGNSIHADRAFLAHPPYDKVLHHLHYRLFDVSAMKEAVRRWGGDEVLRTARVKMGLHSAREDILESIEEARWVKGLIEAVDLERLKSGMGAAQGKSGDDEAG